MSERIRELDDAGFASAIAGGVALVDFYGTWCPPCKQLEPIMERIAIDFAGRATIAKINVDDHSEAAVDNSVSDIPTLVFYKEGKEAARLMGAQAEATIKNELERLLA